MKRITVSLPDELVDKIRAAVGNGQVSAYVARALEAFQERESMDEVLAAWEAETPVPEDIKRQVEAEFIAAGLMVGDSPEHQLAG